MNLQHERIGALCEQLKFARLQAEWSGLAQEAAREQMSFADFLERLLGVEARARQERKVSTLMKLATMPAVKTLEQFDWSQAGGAPKAQIQELTHLAFVERAENVVLLGPSGVGKTHIALFLLDLMSPERMRQSSKHVGRMQAPSVARTLPDKQAHGASNMRLRADLPGLRSTRPFRANLIG